VFDPEQNVHLLMCTHDAMPPVEIVSPGDGNSPIDSLVARHDNGIVYHPCYLARDLAHSLAQLEAAGLSAICVSPPKPAVLFGGRMVSFYTILGMGLIEIIEGLDAPGAPSA